MVYQRMFKMVKGMKQHFNDYRCQEKLLEINNGRHKISKYFRKKGWGKIFFFFFFFFFSTTTFQVWPCLPS